MIYFSFLQLIFSSCAKNANEETPPSPLPQPIADFKYTINDSTGRTVVSFINTSMHAISYKWSFGDGYSSTEINPIHTYDCIGSYTVKLTAFGNGYYPNYSIYTEMIHSNTTPVVQITKITILQMSFVDANGRF